MSSIARVPPLDLTTRAVRPVLAVLLAGAVAGGAAVWLDWRLMVPLAIGVPLTLAVVLATRDDLSQDVAAPAPSIMGFLHRESIVGWTWAALMFATTLRLLAGRRSAQAAAQGNASLDNLVELTVVMFAATIVASAILSRWSPRVPRVALLPLAFAVLTVLSVTWSRLALFSAVRAFEFLVLALFAAYTATRAHREVGFADRLLVRVLRVLAFGTLAMAALGVIEGGLDYDRFAWRGNNPNTANSVMLAATLGVVTHPRRAAITWPLPWYVVPIVLLPLSWETGSRAFTAAGLVAFVAAYAVAGIRNPRVGAAALGTGLVTAALALQFFVQPIVDFVLRDQDAETVGGLNGRAELWEWVLANPVGSEIWGVGVGAVRGNLPGHWNPTNAHSVWIDILQTLGVAGLTLLGTVVVTVAVLAVLYRCRPAAWMAAFVAVSSVTSVTISQPSMFYMLLLLAMVMIVGTNASPDRSWSHEPSPPRDDEMARA